MTSYRIDYIKDNLIQECGFVDCKTKEQAEFLAGNYAAQEKYTGFKVNELLPVISRSVISRSKDRELAIAAMSEQPPTT